MSLISGVAAVVSFVSEVEVARDPSAWVVVTLTSDVVVTLTSGVVVTLTSGVVVALTSGVVVDLTSGVVVTLTSDVVVERDPSVWVVEVGMGSVQLQVTQSLAASTATVFLVPGGHG